MLWWGECKKIIRFTFSDEKGIRFFYRINSLNCLTERAIKVTDNYKLSIVSSKKDYKNDTTQETSLYNGHRLGLDFPTSTNHRTALGRDIWCNGNLSEKYFAFYEKTVQEISSALSYSLDISLAGKKSVYWLDRIYFYKKALPRCEQLWCTDDWLSPLL